jgi:mannose-6-phosphate isomerase-like protein (cupin superfamily)
MSDADADGSEAPRAIHNPVTGVTIREFTAGREGAEIVLAPGADGPAPHVHPEIEERFEVLAGRPTFHVDGRERQIGPGADIWVSPGTPHAFGNPGDEPARIRVRTVPESERLGEVVATLFGLAVEGETDETGRPNPLQAAVMAETTLEETYFADVPDGSTIQLIDDYGSYQQQTAEIDQFQTHKNGLWGVSIVSFLTAVFMIGFAYLPSRY